MASLTKVGDQFTLSIDQKSVDFKVSSLDANGGFKAVPVTAKTINAFGVSLDDKIEVAYKKAQKADEKDSLSLTGSGLYDKFRMNYTLPFQLGDEQDLKYKVEKGVAGTAELSIGIASLFGDTGSVLEDATVKGTYAPAAGANPAIYNWSGDITLDFTPEDKSHSDDITVTLSKLSFGTDVNNGGKRFLQSATLGLKKQEGKGLTLGGVRLEPTELEISYTDNRPVTAGTTGQFVKDFSLNKLNGVVTWGLDTADQGDDIKLSLGGSGTYSQIFSTDAANGGTLAAPKKINQGLTAFEASVNAKNAAIDLGPLALTPKNASISYAADLTAQRGLWNLGGTLGLDVGFLSGVDVAVGTETNGVNEASVALKNILAQTDKTLLPDPGVWSLQNVSASLTKDGDKPRFDLGLVSVDSLTLALTETQKANSIDLSSLGFYKFVDTASTTTPQNPAPTNTPAPVGKQDNGKSIKATISGVKLNSGDLVNTLSGTAGTILDVLSPVKPMVDFFTQDVTIFDGVDQALQKPIVSFLESTPGNVYADGKVQAVEFVDTALAGKAILEGKTPSSLTPAVKAAQNVFTTLETIQNLSKQDAGSVNLGDFSFSYPLNKLKPQPAGVASSTKDTGVTASEPTEAAKTAVSQASNLKNFGPNGAITQQANAVPNPKSSLFTSTSKIDFPILSDPIGYVTKYFSEGSADLFTVDLGLGFAQNFDVSTPVPAFPVVTVGMTGGVNANVQTQIRSSLSAEAITNLGKDFSVANLSEAIVYGTGIDLSNTKAQFSANIGLSVGVDVYIASLKLIGGLEGTLTIQPVLKDSTGNKSANQLLTIGKTTAVANPSFTQGAVKLKDLKLVLEQNLDNVVASGKDKPTAYAANTWLLTLIVDGNSVKISDTTLKAKLGNQNFDRIKLIELDANVIKTYGNDYKTIRINLSDLTDKTGFLYKAFEDALKEQLAADFKDQTFSDGDLKALMAAFSDAAPQSIEYATVDASYKQGINTPYAVRKQFLRENAAFAVIDSTANGAKASKQNISYYINKDKEYQTSNFYVSQNDTNTINGPELVINVNGKLNQPYNSLSINLIPTKQSLGSKSQINIKAKDSANAWQTIGTLTIDQSAAEPAKLSASSLLDEKGAELLLVGPKNGDSNQANHKLVLNLSNQNKSGSSSLAQSIISNAESGQLELAFDVVSGSAKSIAISDPSIIQGGAISVGLESSATNSKLLTNALGQLNEDGTFNGDQLREFAIVAQPTDLLNPAEWSYAKSAFGGIAETSVDISNYALQYKILNQFDSLAVVNAVNRTAVNDTLSNDIIVKTNTHTRQTVDPVSGDTYLSFINQSGLLAVAKRAANATTYQLIKTFSKDESAKFKYNDTAPDLVAYGNKIMGAGVAINSGKIARFLISNKGTPTAAAYQLEITDDVALRGNNVGPIRIGLIGTKDIKDSNSVNELTAAIAYTSDSTDPGNVIIQGNLNLKSSNLSKQTETFNLDLSQDFNNWSDQINTYFNDNTISVDFMEFGSQIDLRNHLNTSTTSTIYSLEGSENNISIWNHAPVANRAQQYKFNIQGITPSDISIVYSKQVDASGILPAYINNWKGTPQDSTNRQTDWSKNNTLSERNFSILVTGTAATNASIKNWTNTDKSDDSESENYDVQRNIFGGGWDGNLDVAYIYSPYNDMYTANIAPLRLASRTTSVNSEVAKQNTNQAIGGLTWTWYPALGQKDNKASNVMTNLNANSDGFLKYGASTVVALDSQRTDSGQPSAIANLKQDLVNNQYLYLPKESLQMIPRADGTFAMSGFTESGKIMSMDQIPNYETALITTKQVFNVPSQDVDTALFSGTASFVDQAEWAPIGIVSAADGVYVGDLRAPLKYARPDQYGLKVPTELKNAPGTLDIGKSIFKSSEDLVIVLESGRQLSSPNGKYTLDMQSNGELILYENTINGRIVIYNFSDFIYQTDRTPLVGGYNAALTGKTAVPGTKLVIKQSPQAKNGSSYNGRYICLAVPSGNTDPYCVPLNPDANEDNNINVRYLRPDKWEELNYDWRQGTWGKTVSNTDNSSDQFGSLQIQNNGDIIAYDQDSSNPNTLFYLKNWRTDSTGKVTDGSSSRSVPLYTDANDQVTTLTNSTPFGFNGLLSDVIRENNKDVSNQTIDTAYWSSLLSSAPITKTGYDIISVSPDLNSTSKFIAADKTRDIVLNGSGTFKALLAKRDGLFDAGQISQAITWGRGTPPANQLKTIRFETKTATTDGTLDQFIQSIWTKDKALDTTSPEFELLNAAIPVQGNATYSDWLKSFKAKYSSLYALNALPVVSSRSYFSVPTTELTPRFGEVSEIYKTYVQAVGDNESSLSIDTSFKLDAFVKVVASFAWWNQELFKVTFPLLDLNWTLKTGYGAGGPVYGSQQIHLDQDHDLIADAGEAQNVNQDAKFSLDLSGLAQSLQLSAESPRNTIWDGRAYVYAPPAEGIDFRSGLLVVQASAKDSVHDTATGLANNKIYITVPDSEYLVANIWTSLKYAPVLDYHFFSTDATDAAKAEFAAESKLRYSNDPYFVTKLTPLAQQDLLSRRLAGIPSAYSTQVGDTFDAYNGIVAADADVAKQAFDAFRFTSRLTLVLETVERLLNRLQLDKQNWGQKDSFQDRSALISSYQLITYLALAAEQQLDPYYTKALELAAAGQQTIKDAIQAGTFQLDLSNAAHLAVLLRFGVLTVPNLMGATTSRFETNGRLNLEATDLLTTLAALNLEQVATQITDLSTSYLTTAQSLFDLDPRLVTAALAPVKRDALKDGGLIDQVLTATPSTNPAQGLDAIFKALSDQVNRNRPQVLDTTRIASITEALENDVDANGQPVQHQAVRIALNHAAPAGGTVVPLTYGGNADYGVDYVFEGNDQRPGYAFIPFGETNVVVPIVAKSTGKDWNLTVGIVNPSSSYNVSEDINKVFAKYSASTSKLSLYDNNVLVRLSHDPSEKHQFVAASPEDRTFDYGFYKNSRVAGIEATGETAKTLQYFVNSQDSTIALYATSHPQPAADGSEWLLINDNVMSVYEGAEGPVDIVQFFNSSTGRYGYAIEGETDHPYQGSPWQNQGVVFSLRQVNREIASAIGTLNPKAAEGTSFSAFPERQALLADAKQAIAALGVPLNGINPNSLRVKAKLADYLAGRTSVVMDLASVADGLWQPGGGLDANAGSFLSSFRIDSNNRALDYSYNHTAQAGARFYSLFSNGSPDTVVVDYAADPEVNSVDTTLATALAAQFAPKLQANDAVLQFVDPQQAQTPLIGALHYRLLNQSTAVQDVRYAVLEASESLSGLSNEALLERSKLLLSSLENSDVTALASGSEGYSSSIALTNGQQLVLLERAGRADSGDYSSITVAAMAADGKAVITTPAGLKIEFSPTTQVSGLAEFMARDQHIAPVLNLTGLDGNRLSFNVEIAREANYDSSFGFYRVLDAQGSVRDSVTGAVITPNDPGYATAALAEANRPALAPFSVGDGESAVIKDQTLLETGYLAPFASVNGTNLFGFGGANPDGRSHFKMLGQNIWGFEDLLSTISDFDHDDVTLRIQSPTLGS